MSESVSLSTLFCLSKTALNGILLGFA